MVIGGSGNGEQMAANKVVGIRSALVWSEETAVLAREHNDANVVSVGGRMHSLDEMTRFVEVFLTTPFSGEERHVRRIGQLAAYETTRELPPLPESALGGRPGTRCLRGTPSTGSPVSSTRAFGGRAVRVGSPQGRFADSAALLDGRVLEGAEAWGKHLFVALPRRPLRARPPRPLRPLRRPHRRGGGAGARSARSGCGWWPPTATRTPTCAAPPPASWSPASSATTSWPGPGPTRSGRTPSWEPAWARIRRSRAPIGGLLMDQTVLAGVGNVYRAEVLFRHRMHPLRPGSTLRVGQLRAMWDDLVVLMAEGVRTGRIDTVRPEHTPEAMGRPPRVDDHGGEVYVYRRTGQPCHVCGAVVRTEVLLGTQPLLVSAMSAPVPVPRRTVNRPPDSEDHADDRRA